MHNKLKALIKMPEDPGLQPPPLYVADIRFLAERDNQRNHPGDQALSIDAIRVLITLHELIQSAHHHAYDLKNNVAINVRQSMIWVSKAA